MTLKEMRAKAESELKTQIEELSREIYQMNCELRVARKVDKPHLIREKKRERARLLTVLTEKSISVRRSS